MATKLKYKIGDRVWSEEYEDSGVIVDIDMVETDIPYFVKLDHSHIQARKKCEFSKVTSDIENLVWCYEKELRFSHGVEFRGDESPNLKVGDWVRVKNHLVRKDGDPGIVPTMNSFKGKRYQIKSINWEGHYRLDIPDASYYYWIAEWLEPSSDPRQVAAGIDLSNARTVGVDQYLDEKIAALKADIAADQRLLAVKQRELQGLINLRR